MNRHPKRHLTVWRGVRAGKFTACGLVITPELETRSTVWSGRVTCELCRRSYEWAGAVDEAPR